MGQTCSVMSLEDLIKLGSWEYGGQVTHSAVCHVPFLNSFGGVLGHNALNKGALQYNALMNNIKLI